MKAFYPLNTRRARAGLSASLITLLACLVVVPFAAPAPAVQAGTTILRVDADTTATTPDGATWFTAYPTLQDALAAANPAVGDNVEIWVAEGTYTPDTSNRAFSFEMKSSVAIYGGFAGSENERGQRDLEANVTVLSGDLNGDDQDGNNDGIPETNIGENAYHVVTNNNTNNTAILDGFTITAGFANGPYKSTSSVAGGMYNFESSPTLANLIFIGNRATSDGGAMRNRGSSPTLTTVTFKGNQSTIDNGGGMYNDSSSPKLTNVTFEDNTAASSGGGMYNTDSSPVLNTVTFEDNTASASGGGMYNTGSSPELNTATFISNTANSGAGMYNLNSSDPTLTNVAFEGNTASASGGGMYNDGSDPTLANVTFVSNQAGDETSGSGGGMYNQSSSPTLTNVIVENNQAAQGGGMFNANSSSPTLTNVTFAGNYAPRGGGGLRNVSSSNPTLTNITFSGNSADEGGGMLNYASSPTLTNVTFSGNSASIGFGYGGAMYNDNNSNPTIQNSIIWGNAANAGDQIYNATLGISGSTPDISYTLVEGGINGLGVVNETNSGVTDSGNNPDGMTNPRFAAPIAATSAPTTTGDYRLGAGSPIINAGNNDYLDETQASRDLNGDGDQSDTITTDLDGGPRIEGSAVALGAYEESPVLTLTKSVNATNPAPGDTIQYTLTITNVGALETSTALISDMLPAGLTFVGPVNITPGNIEITEPALPQLADSVSVLTDTPTTLTYQVEVGNVAVGTVITNTAEVNSDEDATLISSSVALTVAATSDIAVSVTPDMSSAEVGTPIIYTYRITNTGNITLTSISATDEVLGSLALDSNTLEMDEWVEATAVYTPTEDDLPGPLVNIVTATGAWSYDGSTGDVSDTGSVSVEVTSSPAIAVSVAPSASSAEVGEEITYSYRVTNTGNVTLSDVSATDGTFGSIVSGETLAPDAVITATHSYTPTAADLTTLANTVMVTGTPPVGDEVSDVASASVEVTSSPAIAVSVAPSTSSAEVGEEITYSYRVTNTGNVTLSDVSATDGTFGSIVSGETLAPGEDASGSTSYTVLEGDLPGPLTNTVTVTGTTMRGTDVISAASATVQITDTTAPAAPLITSATETSDPYPTISGTADAGATITLTIDLGGGASLTYTTTAGPDGTWSIDLANDDPADGTLPAGGLAPDTYSLTVTATDAAGNTSDPTSAILTITGGTTSDNTTLYLPLIAR